MYVRKDLQVEVLPRRGGATVVPTLEEGKMLGMMRQFLLLIVLLATPAASFVSKPGANHNYFSTRLAAQVSEKEAKAAIDKVANALKRDKTAKEELGNLVSVNNVLGYGSPREGTVAVRFNASFKKGGFGRSSIPMPFGMGQTNESEGRGTMVGQVKADVTNGKVTSCSVFRDLGYGRAFNLKV